MRAKKPRYLSRKSITGMPVRWVDKYAAITRESLDTLVDLINVARPRESLDTLVDLALDIASASHPTKV